MYDTTQIEELLGVKVGDQKPDEYHPAKPYEEYFAEGGVLSIRDTGSGSRIREKINKEERQRFGFD